MQPEYVIDATLDVDEINYYFVPAQTMLETYELQVPISEIT